MSIYTQTYTSPVGELLLGEYNYQLCLCDWHNRPKHNAFIKRLSERAQQSIINQDTLLLQHVRQQLEEYFTGKRHKFILPLHPIGTAFQQQVWQALRYIDYGKTSYYQQIAYNIERSNAIRAVANAIAANPLAIIIPCHRIIAKNGQLQGFAGGINTKEQLLNLEQQYCAS